MYRDTPRCTACDGRCLGQEERAAPGRQRTPRPIERVFVCLVLTHSEALDDQHLCMEEWDRAMADWRRMTL